MAELRPFKGIRYNQEISGDLSKNICPPFDSISPSLQKNLYEISNFNTVRLELGLRGLDSDPYFSAAETQKTWMKEGILTQDDSPSIYVTEEEFLYNNKTITRRGFICALKVEDYTSRIVIPHEKTRDPWVEDRYKLMEVAKSNYSPLLCLYRDDSRETIANLVKSISGKKPYIDIEPEELQKIKVWRVTDIGTISLLCEKFKDSKIYIADGHHRYEAGLRYISNARSTREIGFNESINYRMIQLISMSEPGLITRSYHRYIKLNKNEIENYSHKISSDKNTFKYEEDLSILNYETVEKYYKFICNNKDFNSISFGIIIKEGESIKTLIYSQSNASKNNNDYTFLHERYFQENLELIKEENILFETDLNEIVNLLNREENLIIILMRPIPMENFLSAVDSGNRLPPKVTNFLPKPPAGLVFQTLEGDI
jgi:uncharacterized protein (DUF1015 family)|tara:strand:- start:81177 stop:82460 length:1284 start_codon:yes stop_codon:yes gene_type:complete